MIFRGFGKALLYVGILFACAVVVGIILSDNIKKKGYVVEGQYIKKAIYCGLDYVKQTLQDIALSGNKIDDVFESALEIMYISYKLESIPDGIADKLFLSGRGSWRLTQGNIKTNEWFIKEREKEYGKML